MPRPLRIHRPEARARLDDLYRTFDHVTSATDPIHIVRRYSQPADREVVGFCAAALAFGRVASVLQSIEALLRVMGPQPAAFVRTFDAARDRGPLEPLVHRWIRGRDLVALLLILQRMLRDAGSIEQFFLAGDDASQPDISAGARLVFRTCAADESARRVWRAAAEAAGCLLLFPATRRRQRLQAPEPVSSMDGSPDAIDLGVWTRVSPARDSSCRSTRTSFGSAGASG